VADFQLPLRVSPDPPPREPTAATGGRDCRSADPDTFAGLQMAATTGTKIGKTTADANPTKAFFAQMLAKDISLRAAIFDLLDNSLDGARRLRGEGDLEGLWVHITVRKDRFVIEDNCGGIPVDIAKHYAFRFGRTKKAQEVLDFEHATGQFGVGMKRAIFKLGTAFQIESRSSDGAFSMDQNVRTWVADDQEEWSFEMEVESVDETPEDERGTEIKIAPLHEPITDDFDMADFRASLRRELAKRYVVPLAEGLEVKLNGKPVQGQAPKMLTSPALAPTVRVIEMDEFGRDVENGAEAAIQLRLLCGVARIEAPEAGWSVALNSRMVLLDDKTNASGWGSKNGTRIPVFHNQYGRLRGLALLDSDHTTQLPWNTTKTLLDADHPVYRRVRRELVAAMEPVVKFLNRVKDEVDDARKAEKDPDSQPFHRLIGKATEESAIERLLAQEPHEFEVPTKTKSVATKTTTSIQYDMDKQRVKDAKRALGVTANWQVGEETFDYWWRAKFD
jgi:hypothetical protein